MAASVEKLEQLVSGPVSARGLDLEFVEQRRVGNRTQVRVGVDRDGGVDLDEVAELSREISALFDENEALFPNAYVLEVGSPGVDRPLTLPRHWRRAKGRLVKVTLAEDAVTGRVVRSDDTSATLDVVGDEVTFEFADIRRAVVEVELNPPKGEN